MNYAEAHFVIEKTGATAGKSSHGGQNKQKLWIRLRAFEHFIIMASTANSFRVCEFFIDLKNLLVEFSKYEIAYRACTQLKLKDVNIDKLCVMMREESRQLNEQSKQMNEQSRQMHEQSRKINEQTN